jgi:hypothetical protein
MTVNDPTSQPSGDDFREVFDLVDRAVDGVTDQYINSQLMKLLAAEDGTDPDLVVARWAGLETITEIEGNRPTALPYEAIGCEIRMAQERLAAVKGELADAEQWLREEISRASFAADIAAQHEKKARESAEGVEKLVDSALERSQEILDKAHLDARQILANAEQQAAEITAEAERTATQQAKDQSRVIASDNGVYFIVAPDMDVSTALSVSTRHPLVARHGQPLMGRGERSPATVLWPGQQCGIGPLLRPRLYEPKHLSEEEAQSCTASLALASEGLDALGDMVEMLNSGAEDSYDRARKIIHGLLRHEMINTADVEPMRQHVVAQLSSALNIAAAVVACERQGFDVLVPTENAWLADAVERQLAERASAAIGGIETETPTDDQHDEPPEGSTRTKAVTGVFD